ncbi:U3 small nucleolar RNA-associated protein [Dispira simplex]|nr:U3 small nucleolar RNA-associated protein [Dispira simplex]
MAVASNAKGNCVISASIDKHVKLLVDTNFSRRGDKDANWTLNNSVGEHNNDVRALAILNLSRSSKIQVASGSVDTRVKVSEVHIKRSLSKLLYVDGRCRDEPVRWSIDSSLMLTYTGSRLRVWKRPAKGKPQPVFQLSLEGSTDITSADINPDGTLALVSDADTVRLLRLVQWGNQAALRAQRVMAFPPEDIVPTWLPYHGARWVRFTAGGQQAVVVTFDSMVHLIDLSQWQEQGFPVVGTLDGSKPAEGQENSTFDQEIETNLLDKIPRTTLLLMELSPDGYHLATHNDLGETQVFNLKNMTRVAQLPRFPSTCSVLFFHPTRPLLVVALASHCVYVYNYEKQCFTQWSNEVSKTPLSMISAVRHSFTGGAFIKGSSSRFYLWSLKLMVLFDMDKTSEDECTVTPDKHKGVAQGFRHTSHPKVDEQYLKGYPDFENSVLSRSSCVVDTITDIVSIHSLPSGGLYSIEFPDIVLLKQLPPAFYRQKFI